MTYNQGDWYGFKKYEFEFNGRYAVIVCPEKPDASKRWLLKTEYFGAFPNFEVEMLHRGYHVAHVSSITRWHLNEDTDTRAEFCRFLHKEWGLNEKCVPVGMSCGGMQGVYLASSYPECVSVLYLDAPVMNFLSCPFAVGRTDSPMSTEFVNAKNMTLSELLSFRDHPIDRFPALLEHKIPVALVCGDADTTVPYKENGELLSKLYRQKGLPLYEVLKPGCDHHPHGLEDNTDLIKFIEAYYK